MAKELFLKKTLEHLEASFYSLQKLDFRNFASRFYYAYINLLFILEIKEKGDWHKEENYNFPSDNFKKIWRNLKIWRIRADYEYESGKSFSLYEEEFIEFLKKELMEHITEELIPFLKNHKMDEGTKLILLRHLEVIKRWLKLIL